MKIAIAHECDSRGFIGAAVVVREPEAVPEFVRDAAEIPRVELGHGHFHARVVMLGEYERLILLREEQRIEQIAIGGMAKAAPLIAPGRAVVRRGKDETAIGCVLAETVEDEHVLAIRVEFPRERLANFAPRFVAGFVMVMLGGVLASDHSNDELSIFSLQWDAAGFDAETLLHSPR